MDVRRVIRERRLQEAAEEIRRNSNSDQQGNSIPRSSHLHSARSSMPSLSQYGDAESYKIGEPEETAEWYEHDETGNQMQMDTMSILKSRTDKLSVLEFLQSAGTRNSDRTTTAHQKKRAKNFGTDFFDHLKRGDRKSPL